MKKQIKVPVQFPVVKSGITSASKLQNVIDKFIHELLGSVDGQIPATVTHMDDCLYITSEIGSISLSIGFTSRRKDS